MFVQAGRYGEQVVGAFGIGLAGNGAFAGAGEVADVGQERYRSGGIQHPGRELFVFMEDAGKETEAPVGKESPPEDVERRANRLKQGAAHHLPAGQDAACQFRRVVPVRPDPCGGLPGAAERYHIRSGRIADVQNGGDAVRSDEVVRVDEPDVVSAGGGKTRVAGGAQAGVRLAQHPAVRPACREFGGDGFGTVCGSVVNYYYFKILKRLINNTK